MIFKESNIESILLFHMKDFLGMNLKQKSQKLRIHIAMHHHIAAVNSSEDSLECKG